MYSRSKFSARLRRLLLRHSRKEMSKWKLLCVFALYVATWVWLCCCDCVRVVVASGSGRVKTQKISTDGMREAPSSLMCMHTKHTILVCGFCMPAAAATIWHAQFDTRMHLNWRKVGCDAGKWGQIWEGKVQYDWTVGFGSCGECRLGGYVKFSPWNLQFLVWSKSIGEEEVAIYI